MIQESPFRRACRRTPAIAALLFLAAPLAPQALSQTNLALRKPATQSSTYAADYPASVCVDGDRNSGFCHTDSEVNPWWQVDLGSNYALSQIVVYNRADDFGARERTIRALLSTDGRNWTTIYSHNGSDFTVLPIDAGGRSARYVRLQLAATEYMNIQEVEVFGTGGAASNPPPPPPPVQGQTNLALRKPATQSSTYAADYPASVCVDGDRNSGFCHTDSEVNPWWQVDLGSNYALSQIVVYNRADDFGARERTIRALLSTDGRNWTTIYSHNGSDFTVLPIDAGGRSARYVRLQLAATEYMNIQEVEVFGGGGAAPALDLGATLTVIHPNVCVAIWTRTQPGTYDAVTVCQGPRNTSFRETLTVESNDGRSVVIGRPNYGRYRGTLSADRKTITGTCDWSGCTPGFDWVAYVDRDWRNSPPLK